MARKNSVSIKDLPPQLKQQAMAKIAEQKKNQSPTTRIIRDVQNMGEFLIQDLLIVIPEERPKSNNKPHAGQHWAKRKDEVDRIHAQLVSVIGEEWPYEPMTPVDIDVMLYCKTEQPNTNLPLKPLDSSNIPVKLYEDALIKIGVIPDDTIDHVRWVGGKSEIDEENPRLEIRITKIKEDQCCRINRRAR